MNDLDPTMMNNFDNFQFKLTMKFKNPQQMMTFIKALRSIRQTDNLKVKLIMIQTNDKINNGNLNEEDWGNLASAMGVI